MSLGRELTERVHFSNQSLIQGFESKAQRRLSEFTPPHPLLRSWTVGNLTVSERRYPGRRTQRLRFKAELQRRALNDHESATRPGADPTEGMLLEETVSMEYTCNLLSLRYTAPNLFCRSRRRCRVGDAEKVSFVI